MNSPTTKYKHYAVPNFLQGPSQNQQNNNSNKNINDSSVPSIPLDNIDPPIPKNNNPFPNLPTFNPESQLNIGNYIAPYYDQKPTNEGHSNNNSNYSDFKMKIEEAKNDQFGLPLKPVDAFSPNKRNFIPLQVLQVQQVLQVPHQVESPFPNFKLAKESDSFLPSQISSSPGNDFNKNSNIQKISEITIASNENSTRFTNMGSTSDQLSQQFFINQNLQNNNIPNYQEPNIFGIKNFPLNAMNNENRGLTADRVSLNFRNNFQGINIQYNHEDKQGRFVDKPPFEMAENLKNDAGSINQNLPINNIKNGLANQYNDQYGSGTIKMTPRISHPNEFQVFNPPQQNISERQLLTTETQKMNQISTLQMPNFASTHNKFQNILFGSLSRSHESTELEESKFLVDKYKKLLVSDNDKILINIEKFPHYFKIPKFFDNKSPKEILPLIISSIYFSYILCIQSCYYSYSILNKNNEAFSTFFTKSKFIIGQGEADLVSIFNKNEFKIEDYDNFFSKNESNIINYHLLKLKYLLNDKTEIKEIIQKVMIEMETFYQIPIEFAIISNFTSKFKKGDFSNFLRAKMLVLKSDNQCNMYVFQQYSSYSNSLKKSKENNLEQRDENDLNLYLESCQNYSDPKLMIEQGEIFKKLQNRNVNKEQIINYLKSYLADLMIMHKNVLADSFKLKNEGKPLAFEKKCSECEKDSIFIRFPCKNQNQIDACIFCRKESLMKVIENSSDNHLCKICIKPFHEIEMKIISLLLGENIIIGKAQNANEEEKEKILLSNSNLLHESKISQPKEDLNENNPIPLVLKKSIPRNNDIIVDTSSNFENKIKSNDNEKLRESQNYCAFCNTKGIIGKEIVSNENCKILGQSHFYHEQCLIGKAKEVNQRNGKLADLFCPNCKSGFDYVTISNIDSELAQSLTGNPKPEPKSDPKHLEYEACMFCKLKDGKPLIPQNNCQRKKFHHLYHDECLVNYGWKIANEGNKLTSIECPYCKSEFDYQTFFELKQELAIKLNPFTQSNNANRIEEDDKRQIKPKEKVNQNPIKFEIPELIIPEVKINFSCDIKHVHAKEGDMTELFSYKCSHRYYQSCLLEYLFAKIESFKNIDQIKCPVEGCDKCLLRQMVQRFPKFIDKFDDLAADKINKN